jgi:DMSO/TMAO reductase YedYZ molybdopterin-dependent catalytic subunit
MKPSRPQQLFRETVTMQPENQSSPVRWITDWITPDDLWYRRNHYAYPASNVDGLQVVGAVRRPLTLSCEEIRSRPAKSVVAVMECAGNRRTLFRPRVYGVPWNEGAISQAEWTGVPLRDLLREAMPDTKAKEVVCWGMDGSREENGPFARSLPLKNRLGDGTVSRVLPKGGLPLLSLPRQ